MLHWWVSLVYHYFIFWNVVLCTWLTKWVRQAPKTMRWNEREESSVLGMILNYNQGVCGFVCFSVKCVSLLTSSEYCHIYFKLLCHPCLCSVVLLHCHGGMNPCSYALGVTSTNQQFNHFCFRLTCSWYASVQ